MGTMFDSADWQNIPAGSLAAVYDDGRFVCPAAARSRWAAVLGISVLANPASPAFDSENGNASPAQVVAAAVQRSRSGLWSVIYRGSDSRPSVETAMARAHVGWADPGRWPAPGIYRWGVDWTNQPHLRPGDLATQYGGGPGGAYDLSETFGAFPAAPAPHPTPDPPGPAVIIQTVHDKEAGDMQTLLVPIALDANGNGYTQTAFPFSRYMGVAHQGSDPSTAVDNCYWEGVPHIQDRDNCILVSVTGCKTSTGAPMRQTGVYLTLAT